MTQRREQGTWAIEPHTEAKLTLLSAYLKAWFPILGLGGFERVIYIDGFAGPGRYEQGQDGSPLLALKALAEQRLKLSTNFEFHFVERDKVIFEVLNKNIQELRNSGKLPLNAEVYTHGNLSFEDAYEAKIKPRLSANPNAPAFALVDPFGWTGIPMTLMSELMSRRSTEVLINFMFEEINRFLGHEAQPANFDRLFGGEDWRNCLALSGLERRRCLHDNYRDQLRTVGKSRFVRSFEMRNARGTTDYFLFFGTNNVRGLEKMKEAMWRVDPSGGFSFSDTTDRNQIALFAVEPDRVLLRRLISERFKNTRVSEQKIRSFVVEETPFLASHYKKVLRVMELDGGLRVIYASSARKTGTFAEPGMMLEF